MMTPDRLAALVAMQALANGEKLFRPSAISRLTHCHGSVWASLRAPKERRSSPAAREGTAAHSVAESVLRGERTLDEWTDRPVKLGDDGPDVYCDQEMVDAVDVYLNEIWNRRFKGVELLVEQKLSLSLLDPRDPLLVENAGTADCVLIDREQRKLTILDLKYGKGVMVAGDSPQLKDYALMGLLRYHGEGGWNEVETVVVQPRAFSAAQRIKPVVHSPDGLLLDFVGELVGSMERALDADAPLTPGDHCQFCPAASTCPALRGASQNMAANAFAKVPMYTAESPLPTLPKKVFLGSDAPGSAVSSPDADTVLLPAPAMLDPGDIATILLRRPMWETWIKSIEHRAALLIEGGTTVPGFKLVQRTGNRQWRDAQATQAALADLGVTHGQMYGEPKLRSPAQIEKVLPKAKRDIVAALTERPLGAPTLVSASDAREPVAALLGLVPESAR